MVYLRNLALALVSSLCFFSSNAQVVTTNTALPVVTNPQFGDDTYVHVPLQFAFPFYGKVFTNSWMHSNGVVGFMDPRTTAGPIQGAYCCEGLDTSRLTPQFNYMIAPLWTDLIPTTASTFSTEGTPTYQKYRWENISEYSNRANLNTFGVEIRPTGFIGVNYEMVNLTNQNVFAGTIGDVALNEYNKVYQGRGVPTSGIQSWSVNATGVDLCLTDPLMSETCPGYAQAYLTQQCNASQLYSQACPGYAQAYLTQQCTINPLYSTTCVGYAEAYYKQQCSMNPLYDRGCEGYTKAYFDQQCSISALYDSGCPGYAEAYRAKLTADACSANPQVSPTCPGYVTPTVTQVATTTVASSDGKVSDPTAVQTVADPIVNNVISTPSVTSVTSVVSQTIQPTTPTQTTNAPSAKVEVKVEAKSDAAPVSPRVAAAKEAAKQEAIKKGKDLASEMGSAVSMQDQVAKQNLIAAAMGYSAGFDSYQSVMMRDSQFYKPYEIYKKQVNVDNIRVLRGLQSDTVHREMVDSQYKGK